MILSTCRSCTCHMPTGRQGASTGPGGASFTSACCSCLGVLPCTCIVFCWTVFPLHQHRVCCWVTVVPSRSSFLIFPLFSQLPPFQSTTLYRFKLPKNLHFSFSLLSCPFPCRLDATGSKPVQAKKSNSYHWLFILKLYIPMYIYKNF